MGSGFWAWASDGKLFFGYRARNWSIVPPRPLNATELTAVSAQAFDEAGSPIVIAQQPSYNANLGGYVGWILGSDLAGKKFVTVKCTPTAGPGIAQAWTPLRIEDTNINDSLANALAQLQAELTAPGTGGAVFD